jgi:L-lactate dehydrogenase
MGKNKNKNKIVVVGAGNVGEAIAYTLMLRKQASDIVLVDLNEDRAKGSALDIAHATAFFRQIKVRKGGYEECEDAAIIVITAGMARKPGQTRLDLAKSNVSIVRSITRNIMKYAENPILVVVSNPVDISTYVACQESGLPSQRVIGTGTSLDTARFRYLISEELGADVCDVNAYILGEHGDSQVPVWSSATIAGEPVDQFRGSAGGLNHEGIGERARDSGAEVIQLKGATFYGIAMMTSRIIEAIVTDGNTVLPVSHVLGEEFPTYQGIAFSLPCVINGKGIQRVLDIPMNEEEREKMEHSAVTLRDFLTKALEEPEQAAS